MKTALEELIEKWESEMGSYIPNAPIYRAFIEEAKMFLEKEKEQLCDFYIRGRNEQNLDYYPEKHAKEEYDLVFNKKEDGQN